MLRLTPALHLSLLTTVTLAACGGGDAGDGTPLPPCPSGNCGKESFRKAIPTRQQMLVPFGGARARLAAPAVGAVSEAFDATADHVDEINATLDGLLEDLELLAGSTPEIQEDALHQWRLAEGGLDIVLVLTTSDEIQFQLGYYVGETGFAPVPGDEVAASTITIDDEGLADLTFDIDFDTLTDIVPEVDTAGLLQIRLQPFGDEDEIWYDRTGFAVGGEEAEDSITTYWDFGDGDGALEYIAAFEAGDEATAYVRWDDAGGRYDHHAFIDGFLDHVMTSCWSAGGIEEFGAWMVQEGEAILDGEIDGTEDACDFGPVADHPDPGTDFDDLPAEGEWDDILAQLDE
ncbi:MAG: hypothetical protein F9K40_06520 [Kofleriaceae bacterium]|nr:MAG: hypothetical protein F9K40_06520 [Kofleriaceae bacterium]